MLLKKYIPQQKVSKYQFARIDHEKKILENFHCKNFGRLDIKINTYMMTSQIYRFQKQLPGGVL